MDLPHEAIAKRPALEDSAFRSLFECAPDPMVVLDGERRFVEVNAAAAALIGMPVAELLVRRLDDVMPPDLVHDLVARWGRLTETGEHRAELTVLASDGSERPIELSAVANVVPGHHLCVVREMSELSRLDVALQDAEGQVRELAGRDALTGLPNRLVLMERLQHCLTKAERGRSLSAVLFVDLDNFKVVNDGLGHDAGDALLVAVAPRFTAGVRPSDTVARFGGDEFVILCEDIRSERDAVRVAERILQQLARPAQVDGREHYVTASIGIALARPGADPRAVIRDADAAMYRAKESGRAGYQVFDDRMRQRAVDRLEGEIELRQAIRREQFRLVYQPVVHFEGEVAGVEALLRWDHPERGEVMPASFIPLIEQNGLIVPIGAWVLSEACRQAAQWRREGHHLTVSVNLSPRQLSQANLPSLVEQTLEEAGLPAPSLCVEVTESAVVEAASGAGVALEALQRLGVRIAIDDFGKGQSSLSYLKDLPVDVVKLDRSFVASLSDRREDRAIVAAVMSLADILGLTVIAEGVEAADQLAELRALGCEFVQGFYFGRPSPPELVELGGFPSARRPVRKIMRQVGIPARKIA